MKNVPILGKFLGVMALFGVFILAATLFTTGKMRVIDDIYSDLSDQQGVAGIDLTSASRAMWAIRSDIADLMISNTDQENNRILKEIGDRRAELSKLLDTAANLLPKRADQITKLKQDTFNAMDQACAPAIKLGSVASAVEAVVAAQLVYLHDCAPVFISVSAEYHEAVDQVVAETKVVNDATTDVTNATIAKTWIIMLAGLVIVMLGGFFAIRGWVSKPLKSLVGAMSSLANGNLDVTIAGQQRKDEIGLIARVAQVFQQTGRDKVGLEQSAIRQREAVEADRRANDEAAKARAAHQAAVVESLASGLARLSEGNLVFRLNSAFTPEYEQLRSDFNAAIEKLHETMRNVATNTSTIRSGTSDISTASGDLSRRTEQQAASLEETAAALDEITTTVRRTAEGAKHASVVVGGAKAEAEQSSRVVRQAVEAMDSIQKSAHKIGSIIGVIDEIAFQTNLLALNAGVEAARAGDAGRGFAVVASEVRALAQRSAEAAKEIKSLISASGAQVEQGVAFVGQTGEALARMMQQVAEIDGIVGGISSSAQEQATALQQVNTAVNQMDQVTQQNAAMVEESMAASHSLSEQTGELARLIGQFKVDNAGAAQASGYRSSAAKGSRPSPAPVRALRIAGHGSAA